MSPNICNPCLSPYNPPRMGCSPATPARRASCNHYFLDAPKLGEGLKSCTFGPAYSARGRKIGSLFT